MSNITNIYAYPNSTQSEGILGMMSYVNTISDGIFFPVIMLVLYAILFMISINVTNPSKAFLFTSFIAFALAVPLAILGLFAASYMYLIVFLLGVGVIWVILENQA